MQHHAHPTRRDSNPIHKNPECRGFWSGVGEVIVGNLATGLIYGTLLVGVFGALVGAVASQNQNGGNAI